MNTSADASKMMKKNEEKTFRVKHRNLIPRDDNFGIIAEIRHFLLQICAKNQQKMGNHALSQI